MILPPFVHFINFVSRRMNEKETSDQQIFNSCPRYYDFIRGQIKSCQPFLYFFVLVRITCMLPFFGRYPFAVSSPAISFFCVFSADVSFLTTCNQQQLLLAGPYSAGP